MFLATLTKPNQLITTSGTGGGSYTPAATGNMSSSSCSYQMNHVLERSANQNTNATSRQTAIWQTEQQCPPPSSTSCPEYVRCPDKCVRTISSVPCPDDQSMKAANVAKPLTPWDLLKLDPLVNHTPLISTLDDWEKFLKMKPSRFLVLDKISEKCNEIVIGFGRLVFESYVMQCFQLELPWDLSLRSEIWLGWNQMLNSISFL